MFYARDCLFGKEDKWKKKNMGESHDLRLQGPLTCQLLGGTGVGKSTFAKRLCEHRDKMITPKVDKIIWVYGEWQKMFETMSDVQFVRGISEESLSRDKLGAHTLIFLDDVADEIDPTFAGNLFSKISHHRMVSVILLLNSLFYNELKTMRLISQNTQYYVVFKSPRNRMSLATMARQMFGGNNSKLLMQAYNEATKEKFSYLLIDLKTDDSVIQFRSHIFPGENTICYVSRHHGSK